jgi:DinB superfamily
VADSASQIDALIAELRETSRRAYTLLARHTVLQLLRRPGNDRWCAAECVEHLTLSNRSYLPRIEEALRALRERKLTSGGPFRLDWSARLLKFWLEPPSRLRLPTGAPFKPINVQDAAAAFDDFESLNAQLEEQLASARGLDLSGAKIVSPFAQNVKYSVYSAFVLIAAHNRRHLWQAENALQMAQ